MKKSRIWDISFIVISSGLLILASEMGWLDKYQGFFLIPVVIAYFLGRIVERKTGTASS